LLADERRLTAASPDALAHGGDPLRALAFNPVAAGPFPPGCVDISSTAWVQGGVFGIRRYWQQHFQVDLILK